MGVKVGARGRWGGMSAGGMCAPAKQGLGVCAWAAGLRRAIATVRLRNAVSSRDAGRLQYAEHSTNNNIRQQAVAVISYDDSSDALHC
jgi:hypothetical protein